GRRQVGDRRVGGSLRRGGRSGRTLAGARLRGISGDRGRPRGVLSAASEGLSDEALLLESGQGPAGHSAGTAGSGGVGGGAAGGGGGGGGPQRSGGVRGGGLEIA